MKCELKVKYLQKVENGNINCDDPHFRPDPTHQ